MAELDGTYGAVLIGVFAAAILFGLTNLQLFIYFKDYPADVFMNKVAVCWLWLLDTLHLAFCLHMVYWYLISNYFNPLALEEVVWSFKAQIMLDAIIVVSVHTLYAIRIYKLNGVVYHGLRKRFLLPCVMAVFMLSAYAAALVLCYEIDQFKTYTQLFQRDAWWVTYYPLACTTVMDFVIASSMSYLLARCRTGYRSTNSIISWLMFYTLNTGLITSLCSLLAITMFAAFPQSFAVICVEFSLTKLYVNSCLAMFNARNSLRGPRSRSEDRIALQRMNPFSSISTNTDPKSQFSGSHSGGTAGHRDSHAPVLNIGIAEDHAYSDPREQLEQKAGGQFEVHDDIYGSAPLRVGSGLFRLVSPSVRRPPDVHSVSP